MTASSGRGPTWADLRGRRVGVWGLGVEGAATRRRLEAEGVEPQALVDETPREDERVRTLADGGYDALAACEVVIKSPGISPYDEPASRLAEAGVELTGGLALWLAGLSPEKVCCVTGTKGKSTTTSIAGALARGLGADVATGGNLGVPPWDPATKPAEWWIVEVSSYQAHDLTGGPRVAVVSSLGQDHLTWHHGIENYVRDKLRLCRLPGVASVVVPAGDTELARRRELLGERVIEVGESEGEWLDALGLLGAHNRRNACLARAALVQLGIPGADDDARVAEAAREYQPLRSRLTPLGAVDGVDFVDDSLSTNVLPTLAAVAAFPQRRVALLVGGFDRGIDYAPLADALAEHADPLLVLTMPDNGDRIAHTLAERVPGVEVRRCADLEEAVRVGHAWAKPDGVVLLSPAAPSFGRFRDYAERAEVFESAMRSL